MKPALPPAVYREPVLLTGFALAGEACPAVGAGRFLHAGPPFDGQPWPGPVRGAVAGALVLEGVAGSPAEAEAMVEEGAVSVEPCHHHGAVGAVAGILSPSVPVLAVGTADGRHRAFAPLFEGPGAALRYGSNDAVTIDRLRWLGDVVVPELNAAVAASDPIDLVEVAAEGLRRGDECHLRNVSASAVVALRLAPALAARPRGHEIVAWLAANPQLFLPMAMATAKCIADRLHQAAAPGLVTAMCGNGVAAGIRVSGLGDRWFTGPAPLGTPKLFESYTAEDACPLLGDSLLAETIGLGAFAASAAPALAPALGSTAAAGVERVARMRRVTRAESEVFLLPGEEWRGSPLGIDVGLVVETGVTPAVHVGLAHRQAGRGQAGAGVVELPVAPFEAAAKALTDVGST